MNSALPTCEFTDFNSLSGKERHEWPIFLQRHRRRLPFPGRSGALASAPLVGTRSVQCREEALRVGADATGSQNARQDLVELPLRLGRAIVGAAGHTTQVKAAAQRAGHDLGAGRWRLEAAPLITDLARRTRTAAAATAIPTARLTGAVGLAAALAEAGRLTLFARAAEPTRAATSIRPTLTDLSVGQNAVRLASGVAQPADASKAGGTLATAAAAPIPSTLFAQALRLTDALAIAAHAPARARAAGAATAVRTAALTGAIGHARTPAKRAALAAGGAHSAGTATPIVATIQSSAAGRAVDALIEHVLTLAKEDRITGAAGVRLVATHLGYAGKYGDPLLLGLRAGLRKAAVFARLVTLTPHHAVPDIEAREIADATPGLTSGVGRADPADPAAAVTPARAARAVGHTRRLTQPGTAAPEAVRAIAAAPAAPVGPALFGQTLRQADGHALLPVAHRALRTRAALPAAPIRATLFGAKRRVAAGHTGRLTRAVGQAREAGGTGAAASAAAVRTAPFAGAAGLARQQTLEVLAYQRAGTISARTIAAVRAAFFAGAVGRTITARGPNRLTGTLNRLGYAAGRATGSTLALDALGHLLELRLTLF